MEETFTTPASFKTRLFMLAGILLLSSNANTLLAQLSGTKTIPGDYATITLAVADVNLLGVGAGGVIFDVAAGYTETIAATISLTATGTAANPITFRKSGGGANPLITAYTGGTGTPGTAVQDGIWRLVGSDYVTIDGIDLTDNAANVANPATMEYGYAMYKASVTDGCQNNTIKNCVITLNRINNASGTAPMFDGSNGIIVINSIPTAATTALTPTAASGTNSNNLFYTNTIQNCNIGIGLSGYAAPTPFNLGDTGNDIGGAALSTGNTILNFGGGAATNPAAGLRANNQWGLNMSYNTINNNNGGGVNHATTLRGIYAQAGTSANVTINNNTVTIKSAATTSAATAIENAIGSTAAGNTVNVNNNVIQNCTYTTATTGTFSAILNSATAATVNLNGNTINMNSVGLSGTASSCIFQGIYSSGSATNLNINNNTITNNTVENQGGTLYCTRASTSLISLNNNTITNNSFPANNGTLSASLYGYYNLASATLENLTNNNINNLTISGASTSTSSIIYGIYSFTVSTDALTFSGNTIHTLTFNNTSSGAAAINGLRNSSGGTVNYFKNKIYNLTSNGASSTAFGIMITSGTNVTAYNNLIGDIKTPSANAAIPLAGINITGGTTVNAYFNTVYLNATSTGALFGSAAIYVSSTPTVTLRNNVFVNLSTPVGATGFTAAYRRTSTTLTTYGANSNNNLFYAGVPGANNLIFYDGTNSDQTLGAFKTRVTPRDAVSVTENPTFISTVGANANFLHINTSIATQIESGAANIAGITDDYDAVIRQGNAGYGGTGSAPDIGADEGEFILLDLTAPSITYTPLAGSCGTGDAQLNGVVIADASGVPIAGALRPRIYYKKNASAFSFAQSQPGTLATGNGTNGTWNFTIVAADMGGLAVGDMVSYYVIAQDNAGTPNISSNPTGAIATDVNNVTTHPATPNTLTVLGTLTGTKTVGVGGDYTTLTAAAAAYNSNCVSGAVVFSLIDATYPSESFPIVFNQNAGSSPTNTLTIRPAAGNAATISGASTGCLINFNGSDYTTIDGSNSGGNDRSLTLNNTSATSNSAVVCVTSLGLGAGATNDAVKNCNIIAGSNTLTTFGVYVAGAAISSSGSGADNDNLTLTNNAITKTFYAVYANGTAAVSAGGLDNFTANNNIIGPAVSGVDNIGFAGIWLQNALGATISSNTVQNLVTSASNAGALYLNTNVNGFTISQNTLTNISSSASSSGTSAITGLYMGNAVINGTVSRNLIRTIFNTNSSGYGARGMIVNSATNTTNTTIANNMVAEVYCFVDASNIYWPIGIDIDGASGGVNVYYNSVNLFGARAGFSSGATAAAALFLNTTGTGVNVKNNILSNSYDNTTSTSDKSYAIYTTGTAAGFASINNNDYYASGATGILGFLTSDRTTLAAWQTATGQDGMSLALDPTFVSNTDLHIVIGGNDCLNQNAMPIAGITNDFDNDARNGSNPDIGADEFAGNDLTLTVTETSGLSNNDGITCAGASVTLTTSGGTAYLWSTGATSASITVAPLVTTTYTVTITTAACNKTLSRTITVNPLPTASIIVAETSGIANNDGITCTSGVVTLTASGGGTYLWSVGGFTTAAILVAPLSTTTYTVTVTNANGCTATQSTTITVNPLPTAAIAVTETSGNANNDGNICTGASATLTASGGTNYAWSTGAVTAAITVTPALTTTYTVTVTDGNGCSATSSATITVNPLPTPSISISPNDTICSGTPTTLTASGGATYNWSTGETTAAIVVTPINSSNYTVTVTSAAGCTAVAFTSLTVLSLPSISAVVTQPTTCVSADGAIDLTSFGTYNWATPNGSGLINGQQDQTGLTVGTYNVTVTNLNGCSATASYALNGPGGCSNCPTIGSLSAAPISPVCQNVMVTLTAAGLTDMGNTYGITFKYFAAPTADPYTGGTVIATVPNASLGGGGISAQTTTSFAVASTYFIYAILSPTPTDPVCRPSATTTFVVNASPVPVITVTETSGNTANDGIICAGASATLTASGGGTYAWSTGAVTAAITVTPASTTTYTVTVTSAAGCTASITTTITVNPLPTANISVVETSGTTPNDGIICAGASATLTASGGTSYAWSTGANTAAITVTPAGTTTYTVTVTNANGCTATSSTTITVNPLPTPGIAVTETSGSANNDGIICAGASATLTASGGTSYSWSTGAVTAAITVTPAATTTYTVTVTNANGCSATTSTTITVNPLPTPTITVTENSGLVNNDGIICAGATATLTATGGGTYAWSTGGNTAAINVAPATTTTYTVTVTNSNGCTATATTTITVNPVPSPAIMVTETSGIAPNDGIICVGASATLLASGGGTYAWSTGAVTASITVTPLVSTTYTVTVTNANGCTATATRLITVNPVPTTFAITGGGVRCNTDNVGLAVGLSGSQVGVNYQLFLNGNPVGAPVAGTGAAISFGLQLPAGTYTVVATNTATGCTSTMTGTVTIGTFNCNVAISDPCVCKNNATTLTNGQFGETIKVNAPDGQTWTVSAVNGLYSQTSPLPPSNPFPLPIGTNMLILGGNMYSLTGIHVDAIGYTISVTNGRGTTLSIGNTCEYPNPSITTAFPAEICLFSDPIPLTGNPGDANIVSQTFRVNGVVTNTLNPSLGTGQYTIVYTVDGGVPKAFGPNDPGCMQSVSTIVNVVVTPTNVVCNDQVYVSLDADCTEDLNPDDVLEGTYLCYDDYVLDLDKNVPFGNGPWLPGVLNAGDIGKTYQVRVTHLVSGNKCWGLLKVEDKLAPTLTCENFSVPCNTPNFTPAYLKNTLQIAVATPTATDCQAVTLTYIDSELPQNCASGLTKIIQRKWTASDASGNTSTCLQEISLLRPELDDVVTPPDYDGFDAAYFSCEDNIPRVNGHPLPSPDWIESKGKQGYPHVFGQPTGCTINWEWHDFPIEVCDGTIKYRREWTIIDWCLGDGFIHNQIIKVVDEAGPDFICPDNLTVSTDPFTCCGTINLPDLIVEDNCSRVNNVKGMVSTFDAETGDPTGMFPFTGTLQDFPGNNHWDLDTMAVFGFTACLPIGSQTVTYIAEDACGNTSSCTFKLKIVDLVPPVAACDQFTVVSLINTGEAIVNASTFDDGSYDNCCAVDFEVARMNGNSCGGTDFDTTVGFCCEDIGDTIQVIFRAIDCHGNTNDCMVLVEVQDKGKPTCLPPAQVSVNCENFDPSLWSYGKAEVADNCCLDDTKEYLGQEGLTHAANYQLFDTVCNKGTITRTFRAFDCHGQSSQCTQRIIVNYEQDYFVKFPNDAIVTVCDGTGSFGEPIFYGEDCELLGVSFQDEVFTVVPDACFKIERSWQIINWCTYNPNAPCIVVPNPSPNPITNAAANLPGPTVSACGTIAPWAPTVVKINPTDPQATNFCTFWQKEANCYQYKQIIKVVDGQAPTGTYTVPACANQNWFTPNNNQLWNESYWWDNTISVHDLCEEPTELCITGTDACSGSNINIEYLLFLDLDGDGIMETVINSVNVGLAGLGWNNVLYNNLNTPNFGGGTPRSFDERAVPQNQKYGFSIQETIAGNNKTACVRWNTQQAQNTHVVPELPHGTHKIKWFITDGCGNNKEYEYTFTVKDCKAPTVVCINGLSVNIMPTGMIQLWASDFLQYTEDNCTPAGQLKIGIRKCGTGTGFPVDAQGNPITNVTFTCAELGNQCVELWSMDAAGNADYCETYVIVQDNLGNCAPGNNIIVAGALKTEQGGGIEEAIVNLNSQSVLTDNQGAYSFNNVPLASSFVIAPEKDDNPLNGVTTYDLVLVSKHILGIEPLNTPYKMIAADANKSGSITTFDIVELRKLILGIYTELPNNTSWRFIDKSFNFPNPINPFQTITPETISVSNALVNQIGQDFVGVKVGDVNNTAIANATMQAEERTVGTAIFDLEDREVKAGEVFEVSFKSAQALKGFQFTATLNGLKAIGTVDAEHVSENNFNLLPGNAMAVSINGAQSFTVRFRAEKAGRLSEMLGVSGSITRAEAYGDAGRLGVAFRFDGKTIAGVGFELYQNQPNPFVNKTNVGFFLPEAAEATLSVFDESGRVVYQQKGQFAKGENNIQLDRALLNTSGLLYYRLETATDSDTKKMIQTK